MKQNTVPILSVVMPVYNAGSFLVEAIESIRNQTYTSWELFAIDDHSTDNSWQILKKYEKKDSRIKVYKNGKHRGVAGAANLALSFAKGTFIARMDADDISHPTRFARQIAFLEKNKDVVAVGGQCELIDEQGKKIGWKQFPTENNQIHALMFNRIPLQQPTLMVNTSLLPKDFIWYEDNFYSAEEVELLFRLFKYGKIRNMPQVLLKYRIHPENTSLKDPKKTFFLTLTTRLAAIFKHDYRPTLNGVIVSIFETIAVIILPSKYIYPVYAFMQNVKQETKLTINAMSNWIKVKKLTYGY
jgi:glycosyltransferase involved in cell wall biosynthesis